MKNIKVKIILIVISLLIVSAGLGGAFFILGKKKDKPSKGVYGAETPEKAAENMMYAIAEHDGDKLERAMFPEKYISDYDKEAQDYWGMNMREYLSENVGSVSDQEKGEIINLKIDLDEEDISGSDDMEWILEDINETYGINLKYDKKMMWYKIDYDFSGVWMYDDGTRERDDESGNPPAKRSDFTEAFIYQIDGKYYCIDPWLIERH